MRAVQVYPRACSSLAILSYIDLFLTTPSSLLWTSAALQALSNAHVSSVLHLLAMPDTSCVRSHASLNLVWTRFNPHPNVGSLNPDSTRIL